jgi:hypothetical protein
VAATAAQSDLRKTRVLGFALYFAASQQIRLALNPVEPILCFMLQRSKHFLTNPATGARHADP